MPTEPREQTQESGRGEIAALAAEAGATLAAVEGLSCEESFETPKGLLMLLPGDDTAVDTERRVAHLLVRQLVARLGRSEALALVRRICQRAPVAALLVATLAAAALDPFDGVIGRLSSLWPR